MAHRRNKQLLNQITATALLNDAIVREANMQNYLEQIRQEQLEREQYAEKYAREEANELVTQYLRSFHNAITASPQGDLMFSVNLYFHGISQRGLGYAMELLPQLYYTDSYGVYVPLRQASDLPEDFDMIYGYIPPQREQLDAALTRVRNTVVQQEM